MILVAVGDDHSHRRRPEFANTDSVRKFDRIIV